MTTASRRFNERITFCTDAHRFLPTSVNHADKSVYDLLPHFLAQWWVTDRPEGVAVTMTGELFVVSDNDAVDDWSGETCFFGLGRYWQLFD